MKIAQKSPGRRREEDTGIAISVDTSAFDEWVTAIAQDDPFAHNIQAEFAMKITGTCAVSNYPVESGEPYFRIDLSMFPGKVTGDILAEGLVNAAAAGVYGPHDTAVLEADKDADGKRKVYPDDLLFRGFIGWRVQVIKTAEGIYVRKI